MWEYLKVKREEYARPRPWNTLTYKDSINPYYSKYVPWIYSIIITWTLTRIAELPDLLIYNLSVYKKFYYTALYYN